MANREIQRLESIEDLKLLVAGDIVEIRYKPAEGENPEDYRAVVIPETISGRARFVVRHPLDEKIARCYIVPPKYLGLEDGRVVLREEDFVGIRNSDNSYLTKRLEGAGL